MCKNPSNEGTPLTVLDVKIQRQFDPSTLSQTDFFGLAYLTLTDKYFCHIIDVI